MSETDRTILRDLARRYLEICRDPVQEERRRLWRDLNSRRPTRPLIYVRAFAWSEMAESVCRCQDPLLRQYEDQVLGKFYADASFERGVAAQQAGAPDHEYTHGLLPSAGIFSVFFQPHCATRGGGMQAAVPTHAHFLDTRPPLC